MANSSSNQKSLIGVILLLVAVLVVGFVMWQRDQESKDLNINIGMGDAQTLVEPGPALARGVPEGFWLSTA